MRNLGDSGIQRLRTIGAGDVAAHQHHEPPAVAAGDSLGEQGEGDGQHAADT